MDNVCHFVPYHQDYHSIHTIHFVLETTPQKDTMLKSQAVYKMHLVCSGTGKLHTAGKIISLKKGDVFFTFPGTPYCIESVESFTYMYISFLGSRGNMIMDNLKISSQNYVFSGCEEIQSFWEKGIDTTPETADLIAESVLLYSFYFLGNEIIPMETKRGEEENIAPVIKKYVDDNFSRHKLTLEHLSAELLYSPKYISAVFKKKFNVGFAEYLNTIRIQNACTLIRQGFTNVSGIANRCGYEDPQYFSKVFKEKMGISPKTYILEFQKDEKYSS